MSECQRLLIDPGTVPPKFSLFCYNPFISSFFLFFQKIPIVVVRDVRPSVRLCQ